jgi:outer membrane receptor for ferrienterochelin and colicins
MILMKLCNRNRKIMRKIYLLLTVTLISTCLKAQTVKLTPAEDTTKAKELGEVVLTGQYKPQSARNSVYQVRSISKERIQQQGAAKLQDVLNNELNIRFSQDLATGGSGITMMGLPGQNVKILLDGVPLVGRQGATNEININQIDINTIERVEIVEGPMSVVYGADALAGVINIITKKANASKLSVTARVHEETIGKEYSLKQGSNNLFAGIHNQYAGLSWRNKKWEIGGGFGHNYFGGWKDTAVGRELVWHNKDQLMANGFIGYNGGKFNLRYRVDGLDEIIYNPGNYTNYYEAADDWLASDQEYLTRRVMQQLQGSYVVNGGLSFQSQIAYTDYSRQVYSTNVSQNTKQVTYATGADQSLDKIKGFTFRGTAFYKLSPVVSFQPGVDINLESGEGQRLKEGNNEVNDYAFFITSEITPSKKVSIRPGLRFIKNSVYDAPPVIPSINTKFVLADNLDLRLSYARGFRSPSLRELYFNFFDANHQIVGNPDLKAESSHSFNGSLTWKKTSANEVVYSTSLGGFYNNVKNLIDYAVDVNDPGVFTLTNISDSKTAGATLATNIKHKQWNISLGAGYTGFYNASSEADDELPQLQWSAEVNSTIGYRFSKIGLDANLFYKFTGKKPFYALNNTTQQVVLTEQEGYHMADFTLNKKLFKYFSLNAGIRNLFNVDRISSTYSDGSTHSGGDGIRNIASGRAFFAGLTFNWDKK